MPKIETPLPTQDDYCAALASVRRGFDAVDRINWALRDYEKRNGSRRVGDPRVGGGDEPPTYADLGQLWGYTDDLDDCIESLTHEFGDTRRLLREHHMILLGAAVGNGNA